LTRVETIECHMLMIAQVAEVEVNVVIAVEDVVPKSPKSS
jgi:hypothetical protein